MTKTTDHDFELHGKELTFKLLTDPILILWVVVMVAIVMLFAPSQTVAWLLLFVAAAIMGVRSRSFTLQRRRLHNEVTAKIVDLSTVDVRDEVALPTEQPHLHH